MKRFQEVNNIIKIWRYRYYLYIPFKWIWYKYIKPFEVTNDRTFMIERVADASLWKILVGIAQGKMNWYYTEEEIKSHMDKMRKSLLNNEESK